MRPIEGLLIDLDGTVYLGRDLIPGSDRAVERVRGRGIPVLFTTNTSRMSRSDIAISLIFKNLWASCLAARPGRSL